MNDLPLATAGATKPPRIVIGGLFSIRQDRLPIGSNPELAGYAALFVKNDDAGLEAALLKVGEPLLRAQLRAKGFDQALLFSWKKAADQSARISLQAATLPEKSAKETGVWKELREKEHQRSYRQTVAGGPN